MTETDTPKDGDFASYLARNTIRPIPDASVEEASEATSIDKNEEPQPLHDLARQAIEEMLFNNEEPTDELLEEISVLESASQLSEDDLERQALEHPGDDSDPLTPE